MQDETPDFQTQRRSCFILMSNQSCHVREVFTTTKPPTPSSVLFPDQQHCSAGTSLISASQEQLLLLEEKRTKRFQISHQPEP